MQLLDIIGAIRNRKQKKENLTKKTFMYPYQPSGTNKANKKELSFSSSRELIFNSN